MRQPSRVLSRSHGLLLRGRHAFSLRVESLRYMEPERHAATCSCSAEQRAALRAIIRNGFLTAPIEGNDGQSRNGNLRNDAARSLSRNDLPLATRLAIGARARQPPRQPSCGSSRNFFGLGH